MSDDESGAKKKALTRLSVGMLVGVGVLAWALIRAHTPGREEIAAFFDYALRYTGLVVFDDKGTAISPPPEPDEMLSGSCNRIGGTDADRWACVYRYEGTDGQSYSLALTALLRATLFRPDRFDIANVGMYRVDIWAETDQRAMLADAGVSFP